MAARKRRLMTLLAAGSLAFSLAACGTNSTENTTETDKNDNTAAGDETLTEESVRVLAPQGAPALAVLGAYKSGAQVDTVEGTDVLTAELAKEDSDYDIIVAPVNLGAKIYAQKPVFNLDAVLTWGNLYVVGPDDTDPQQITSKSMAAFGENAVPGLVFNQVMPEAAAGAVWYPSVAESQQALLSGKEELALLAQPAAAATIAKAKDNGQNLAVLADLQKEWQETQQSDEKGYPQAGLFVKSQDNTEGVQEVIDQIKDTIENGTDDERKALIAKAGTENLGIPNEEIALKTWDAQNIRWKSGQDAKEDLQKFLSVFTIELPEGLIR